MSAKKLMIMGCGFLASHFISHLIPHGSQIILVDRDRVEKKNYDNHIIPKGYEGKRKVTAHASLLQLLTSCPVIPIHMDIKSSDQMDELYQRLKPDILFVTFDNIESRNLVKNWTVKNKVPCIFAGVTENYIYVDWAENVVLPSSDDIEVKDAIARIQDVCSTLEFRGLGVFASALVYASFKRWLENGERRAYMVSITDRVRINELIR
jgi:molybdopterin/thiamine biosynthesis adenylyltransferase